MPQATLDEAKKAVLSRSAYNLANRHQTPIGLLHRPHDFLRPSDYNLESGPGEKTSSTTVSQEELSEEIVKAHIGLQIP